MNSKITVATLQHAPTPNNLPASLARLESAATKAAAAGANILVVPECSITGYNQPLKTMQQVAIRANGSTSKSIAALCTQHNIAIAYGFAERDAGQYFNTVQVINAAGEVAGSYRKTHLWGDLDRTLFTPGDTLTPVFEIAGWQIGLLICYDIEFPENTRALALAGAELLLVPTGLMHPWRDIATRVVPVRAYENQFYIAYCNYCDTEADLTYEGRSCIVGPEGADLARADQTETLLVATLDKQTITDNRVALPYHRDRLPHLYKSLAE